MGRLALLFLVGLFMSMGLPAAVAARDQGISFYLIDSGTVPGPAVLSIEVQTDTSFSCTGYSLPTSARVNQGVIEVRLGAVQRPRGDLCATAFAPARGSANIGALAAGTYRLRLIQGSAVDVYVLTVSSDGTELKPQQGRFSTSSFQAVSRVSAGAAHLSCIFGLDARCAERARQGSATCETLFADPRMTALTPLGTRPAPYSQSWFNESGRIYAAPAFETLRPVVASSRYRDAEGCLLITVHSGRGESFSNRNP